MKIIKNLKSTLFILGLLLVFNACKKDDFGTDFPVPAQYAFAGISDSNTVYAYKKTGGETVALTESEIDLTILNDCNQVFLLDDLHFTSVDQLDYTAFDIWGGTGNRPEVSAYDFLSDEVIRFTFFDEFGNDSNADLVLEGSELKLNVFAYVEVRNGSPLSPEVYKMQHNQIIVEEEAASRAQGLEEGDVIYLMVYQQIYSKQ